MRSLEKDLLLFEAGSFLSIFFQVRSFCNSFPSSSEATEMVAARLLAQRGGLGL